MHVGDDDFERRPRDPLSTNDEPLGEVDQMRGSVTARPVAGSGQRPIHHRDHRTLAVGSGHVHCLEGPFGMSKLGDECVDVVQAELDAELFEPEEPVEWKEPFRIQ